MIRSAKQRAAVVLTTHSMEEAEALCDRIGIFVGGKLSCIGNPQVAMYCYQSLYYCCMTQVTPAWSLCIKQPCTT